MKQINGQMDIFEYLSEVKIFMHCADCVCKKCLYWWSGRCPYGSCYDDRRAREQPYNEAHPDRAPRITWSDWNKSGEQAHWCRGGSFYPTRYCEKFIKYSESVIEECINCNIQVFQDGYVSCSLKETIGCEVCMRQQEGKENQSAYECQYMTDTGCEKLIAAKNQMLDAIAAGSGMEMCKEQCCIKCRKVCKYRCGEKIRIWRRQIG